MHNRHDIALILSAVTCLFAHRTTGKLWVAIHDDTDHVNGAQRIIDAYQKRITRAYYVSDRDPGQNRSFHRLDDAHERGWIVEQPCTISISNDMQRLFPLENALKDSSLGLVALAPRGHEAEKAKAAGEPNQASAVIVLKCGKSTIVFPGDATLAAWKGINQRHNGEPIHANVFVVPHHGGHLNWPRGQASEIYSWLLSKVVSCEYGVVSVGTNNSYKHPLRDVINALHDAGVSVVCTEATETCANCSRAELLKERRRRLSTPYASYSTQDNRKVPCIGTIAIDVREDSVDIINVSERIQSRIWGSCPATR